MLYTIGTSNRTADEFYGELARRSVGHVIDVRSSPYSRLSWFNGSTMSVETSRRGMTYRWMGRHLGGRSSISALDPDFATSLRVLQSIAATASTAMFCAEGDPAHCHRSYLVGRALLELGDEVVSIRRDGSEEGLRATLARMKPAILL